MRQPAPRPPGFPSRLQAVITRNGTIQRVSELTGQAPKTISDWLRGVRLPHASTLNRFCEILGVDPVWLAEGEEAKVIPGPTTWAAPIPATAQGRTSVKRYPEGDYQVPAGSAERSQTIWAVENAFQRCQEGIEKLGMDFFNANLGPYLASEVKAGRALPSLGLLKDMEQKGGLPRGWFLSLEEQK